LPQFQQAHREWVEAGLSAAIARRNDHWSETIAVGREGFVERRENELNFKAQHRPGGLYILREPVPPYGDHFDSENNALRAK
jgi:hypothetical protein